MDGVYELERFYVDKPELNIPKLIPIPSTLAPKASIIQKYQIEEGTIYVEYQYRCSAPVKTTTDQTPVAVHVYENITKPFMLFTLKIN